jgi:hypothetical protein
MNDIQPINLGMEKHLDGDSNCLHVSVGSFTSDLPLSGLHIVDNGLLDDGDF